LYTVIPFGPFPVATGDPEMAARVPLALMVYSEMLPAPPLL
jgi:hypothetical protein